jgi:Cyclin.
MDLEAREDFDESTLIFQNDTISYKDAYKLNKFKLADTQQIIEVISGVLIEILKETDKIPDQITTSFHAKSVPAISVKDYLARIAKCSKCSDECLILALIYIDKITERNKKFIIKSLNIHR